MDYNSKTGKRKKWSDGTGKIRWVHKILERKGKIENYNLAQCLFGEQQITIEPNKPIAIVESEKTAIIATSYLPQYIWLAVGGASYLTKNMLMVLKGRDITLYPDKGVFDEWSRKANEWSNLANFTVSDLLKRKEAEKGSDLADYLVKHDLKTFQHEETKEPIPEQALTEFLPDHCEALDYQEKTPLKKNLPNGYYYDTWERYDGMQVKNLINESGYPSNWD